MSTLNRYFIGYPIEGSLNSHQPSPSFLVRKYPIKLFFSEIKENQGDLLAFVEVSAKTHMKAHGIAVEVMSELIDVLSFVMKSSLFLSPPSVMLKDEKGNKKRIVYRQTTEDKISGLYLREDTINTTQELLDAMEKESSLDLPLRWLRFGYRAQTYPERFTYYWLALERIVGESQIEKKCPNCKEQLPSHLSIEKSRMKTFCQKYDSSIDDDYFKKLWKYRQKIFHGTRIDTTFLQELIEVTPKIEKIIENFLTEKYKPQCRITVESPVPKFKRTNINGFYEFQASDKKEPYAMNYPTNEQLQEFHLDSGVIGSNGFELMTYDEYENW